MQKIPIAPELEAFFVAIALEYGTHPCPTFGIERAKLGREVSVHLSNHPGAPDILVQVRRNYAEMGGKLLAMEPQWFWLKLADAYLDWIYSQPESMALLPAALEKYQRETREMNRKYEAKQRRQWIKF